MPYPKSPFGDDFDTKILWQVGDDERTTVNEIQNEVEILEWLCGSPKITSFRINTLKAAPGDVRKCIETHLEGVGGIVEKFGNFEDAVFVRHPPVSNGFKLKIYAKEVVVDTICAAAVLRGAHIYAPGVLAMMTGTRNGDFVSIYADLAKKCKKGFSKLYEDRKVFIGNGIAKMDRHELFCENAKKGVAVQIQENISSCPPVLGDDFLPPGLALLQNLPSIICVHVLDPKPDETILDMCASPGNKTTHIAALKSNQGKLVAIDKTPSKVAELKKNCDIFGADVTVIKADSTRLTHEKHFSEETFDRILLDAPCSALGKRPQLLNTTSIKVLRSYVPLQRKLFANAVQLLKKGGILVYSTCTITLAENEGIVAWALKNLDVELVEAAPMFGGPGLSGTTLTEDELKKIQRFGPRQEIDSVGFFIAKLKKKVYSRNFSLTDP